MMTFNPNGDGISIVSVRGFGQQDGEDGHLNTVDESRPRRLDDQTQPSWRKDSPTTSRGSEPS